MTDKPICPRCGGPLETKRNVVGEKFFACQDPHCDYRFRPLPTTPDPRFNPPMKHPQRKGI